MVSSPSTAADWTQRRIHTRKASVTPSSSARPASGHSAERSRSAIGPSMIARVTSGMPMASATPPSDATSMSESDHT